jgi:signal transduction histidine kinase
LPLGRTTTAALLAGAAAVIPCSAWYIVGSQAARQEARRLIEAPRSQARSEAERLAQRLASRLGALRQTEARRPFTDYWSNDELVESDFDFDVRMGSPLAEGPADPLIWAHFQIDSLGRLTLPTLNESRVEQRGAQGPSDAEQMQFEILEELECASTDHLTALRRAPQEEAGKRLPTREGLVTVGPFSWHTARLGDEQALVALREVQTPSAVLTQGFVVLATTLAELLDGAPFPARIRPGDPVDETEAQIPILGDAWAVGVDASQAIATAQASASGIVARFSRFFIIGAFAALLAAGSMVALVWHSERLARQRERFAASAAHELRTPLAGLQLYGEMLADGSGDPSRSTTYARRIAEEAGRLGRVVSNVLGFSHLELGDLTVRPTRGDLVSAVRESVDRLLPALESAGADVQVQVAESIPPVRFDRDAVHQILQNLLDNAEKYTRNSPDRTFRVSLNPSDDGVALAVTDRGPGVDPALRRRLFQPFTRTRDPAAPAGLGIGLALVQALAHAQDANVTYTRVEQGGSSFTLVLPSAAADRQPDEST